MIAARISMLVLLAGQSVSAQFTYPLAIGNRWQFREPAPSPYVYEDRVVGDTLLSNGISYRKISMGGNQFYYFRQEGQRVYQYHDVRDSAHPNHEIVRFDFSAEMTPWTPFSGVLF